jgi:hypothetical protein
MKSTQTKLSIVFCHGIWADGSCFSKVIPPLQAEVPGTAWKSKASWYILANNDQTVHPDLQRFVAKRMGASAHAVDSSHVPMLSHPKLVIDVIRAAAKAVKETMAVA